MKILVSITTTTSSMGGSTWRDKIKEAKKLGLTEVALFLTCVRKKERQKLYKLLKGTAITSIPFIHLGSDVDSAEMEFLINTYGAKIFNIHSIAQYPLIYDLSKYRKKIYMENTLVPILKEAGQWAGICLDVSHHENRRLMKDVKLRQDVEKALKKYTVGAWHLNAITTRPIKDHEDNDHIGYDCHHFSELKEFDYCKKYKKYLPKYYIALELENTLADQLRAKAYITKLLKS